MPRPRHVVDVHTQRGDAGQGERHEDRPDDGVASDDIVSDGDESALVVGVDVVEEAQAAAATRSTGGSAPIQMPSSTTRTRRSTAASASPTRAGRTVMCSLADT